METLTIVVIESGFVYIGFPEAYDCPILGKALRLKMAYNIEIWGTSEGLGQLANVGKQKGTILRFTGSIICPVTKVLHFIPVEPKAAKTYGF